MRALRPAAVEAELVREDQLPGEENLAPPVPRMGWQLAISSTVAGLNYELVDVERAQRGLLRITIDRIPGHAYVVNAESPYITVEDCEKVTRQLQYVLEVEGLDYARLEVSSPGLDRPLKTAKDYERFVGQDIQLVLKLAFNGRKNWQGTLCTPMAAPQAEPPVLNVEPGHAWSLLVKDGKAAKAGRPGKAVKPQGDQVLGFTLDEVREARLVPVVNFKGRKAEDDGDGAGTVLTTPDQDGG